jgi:prepilin-type N-terminal cleavage/methylation domain-containing protein
MALRRARLRGFTLIELMVTVSILGVLAAIAIPSFVGYVRRSRAAEAMQTLGALYSAASALYVSEHAGRHIQSTTVTACVAEPTDMSPAVPGPHKQRFTGGPGFDQLAFKVTDFVFFGYGISSIGTPGGITCFSNASAVTDVYTFYAHGDLDGDGIQSTFEMPVGSNGAHQLYHSRGLYIANDSE